MSKKEFGLFAAAMKTYYPREQLLPNQQAMELWYRELRDIPYQVAETALRKWVAISKWPPSIAEIRLQAATIQTGEIPSWADGWDECCKKIGKYGGNRAAEAIAEMSEITTETVKRLGFRNLCVSENPAADRANFRIIYEQIAEQKKTSMQIPETLKIQVDSIRKGVEHDEGKRLPETD